MRSLRFLPIVTVAFGLLLASCTAPVAPTPTQAPAPVPPQPTAAPTPMPTQALPPTPAPSATQAQEVAYPAPAEPTPTSAEEEPYPAPATQETLTPAALWNADGVIGADEYSDTTTIGPVTLWWRHDGTYLYLAAEARTRGWLAVGLDPEDRMKGANHIIAAHDGEARIADAYGTAPTGANHPADTTLGGTDDIVAYAVVEQDGVTRFEVQIPLDSGDAYDKPLQPGKTYPVIVAIGASDAFTAPHTFRGAGTIALSPTP